MTTAEKEAKPPAKPRVVRYTGTSDVRKITRRQWEQAGVEGQDEVAWSAGNGFQVPVSALNEEALALLAAPEFKITAG